MNIENSSFDYSVEIDRISKKEWETLMLQFRDATINQTWSFGAVLSGESNLSHLVLKRDNEVVAAAQIRIVTLPIFRAGIAYLAWGPMWQRRNKEVDLEDFRQIVKALRNEYAVKRGLLLRVLPNVFSNDANATTIGSIFVIASFRWRRSPHKTLFLDLTPSLESLRKELHPKWRNHLKQAEGNNLKLYEGSADELFDKFKAVYKEMRARKKYPHDIDIEKYATIQKVLPTVLKLKIVLGELDGKTIAGTVSSTIGDTAVSLLSATGDEGLKNRASYLVRWRTIQWLKEKGHRQYDLGGVDPDKVPTTYEFKARICGKQPRVYTRIGDFIACESLVSTLAVKSGEFVKSWKSRIKGKIASSNKHIDHQRR